MQLGRATMRAAKAVTKGYSDAQSKVRDATKNDSSSPTARELDELARLSYSQVDFVEMMEILDKRLNDKGKLWRHVYKALTVINHLLHAGSPQVYHYCHNNLYVFKTLREFQYVDDDGVDVGQNVRAEAREVTRVLMSPEELKRRRGAGGRRGNAQTLRTSVDTDKERERERERERRRGNADRQDEDDDLKKAIELSKREEEDRLRKIRESNNGGLFDVSPSSSNPPETKEDLLIDLSDSPNSNVSAPVQVQYTAYTPYAQYPQAIQTQYTSFPVQAQYTSYPVQAQYTSFQPTGNPLSSSWGFGEAERRQAEWQQQQQQQLQLQQQQQQEVERWQEAQTQFLHTQPPQTLSRSPEPTVVKVGSNNPFARPPPSLSPSSSPSPSQSISPSPSPSLSTSTSSRPSSASSRAPSTPFSPTHTHTSSRGPPSRMGAMHKEEYDALEEAFVRRLRVGGSGGAGMGGIGEGVDTFGNVGLLRGA